MPVTTGIATAAISGTVSLISSTIKTLSQKGLIQAQTDSIYLQNRLSILSNQQQDVLATKLAQAQSDNERLQILTDAAAQVDQAQIASDTKRQTTTALIILGALVVLAGVVIIAKKYS